MNGNDDKSKAFDDALRSSVVAGWFDQAMTQHRQGNLTQAQVFYQRVLDAQPDHPEALNFLGILMQQRGQSTQAEQFIRRAIRSTPDYAAAYTNLGNVLIVQKRYEDAIAAYRQATIYRADEVEACVNMGAVLRGWGGCRKHWRRTVRPASDARKR
ncbi:MAG: tetratricopeptide repeat protein [Gammaproteobacteria bacterium]|nr:tetratricopeptide repeat protein [Gammaproteobacteria bacterium]